MTPFVRLRATLAAVAEVRIVAAVLLFSVALYWGIAATYEICAATKPHEIFGVTLLRSRQSEPVLTASQWRKGGLFLLAMAGFLVLLGIRLLQGWP